MGLPPATRAASVPAVILLATLTACGGSSEAEPSKAPSAPPSESASASPSSSETASAVAEPGASADGTCGDGDFETKRVRAADGVTMTVPAQWDTPEDTPGVGIRLYPPDQDAGDGYLILKKTRLSLERAAGQSLAATEDAAEKTSQAPLRLKGFDEARMVTFAYDAETFAVYVVAKAGDLFVQANLTREGIPEEQAVAESCFSTLAKRT